MNSTQLRRFQNFAYSLILMCLTLVFVSQALAQNPPQQAQNVSRYDDLYEMSRPSDKLWNRVQYDPFHLQPGDLVVVQLRAASELNPLTPEDQRYEYQLRTNRRAGPRIRGEPYWHYRIVRTWTDFEKTPEVIRRREFHLNGTKPLRPLEVELEDALKPGREKIYHIAELALTANVDSQYFSIGDEVVYPEIRNGLISYKDGVVTGIYGNGDLIVKRGIEYQRVKPHDLFASKRIYTNHQSPFKPKQKVSYRFERPASDIITYEEAEILGINPLGEALVRNNKEGATHRISLDEQISTNTKPARIVAETPEIKKSESIPRHLTPRTIVPPKGSPLSGSPKGPAFTCVMFFNKPR